MAGLVEGFSETAMSKFWGWSMQGDGRSSYDGPKQFEAAADFLVD